jgi:hypothetical protein
MKETLILRWLCTRFQFSKFASEVLRTVELFALLRTLYSWHKLNSNRVEMNKAEALFLQHLRDSYSVMFFCQHGRWKDFINMDTLRNGIDWNQVRTSLLHGIDPCLSKYFSSRNPKNKSQKLLRNPYLSTVTQI